MVESVSTVKFSCICMAMNVTRTRNEFNRIRQVDAGDRWTWAQERRIAESVRAVVLPVSVGLGMLRQHETS